MNTDITKCTNEDCSLRNKCHRYLLKPNVFNQSYSRFEPEIKDFRTVCSYFIPKRDEYYE